MITVSDGDLVRCLYAVVGVWGLLFLAALFRGYRLDKVRDDLFALRDEMFDYAAAHGLLAHPGYQELRAVFNAMLRFCHRLTFVGLVLAMVCDQLFRSTPNQAQAFAGWLSRIEDLSPEHKRKLIDYHLRMLTIAMEFVAQASPLARLVVGYYRSRAMLRRAAGSIYQTLAWDTRRGWQSLEKQALET